VEAFSFPWALIVIAINGRAKMVVNFLTTLFRLSKIIVNQSLFRGGSRRLFFAQGLTDFYNSGSKGIGKPVIQNSLIYSPPEAFLIYLIVFIPSTRGTLMPGLQKMTD
jgi:hypothetical protein